MAQISIPTSIAGITIPGALGSLAKGPLSALFSGAGLQTYNYPLDLATDPAKSHYITFSVKQVIPASYNDQNPLATPGGSQKTSGGASNFGSAISPQSSQIATSIENGINAAASALGGESIPVGSAGGIVNTAINVVTNGIPISPQYTKSVATISLYMPDTVNASYQNDYNETSISSIGLNNLKAIDTLGGEIGKGIRNNTIGKTLQNIVGSDPETLKLLPDSVAGLGGAVNGGAVKQFLINAEGYAVNPQVQVIYNQINLRQFDLAFSFSPRSQSEADMIDQIIFTFKDNFVPILRNGITDTATSLFLIQPSIFNLSFNIQGIENKYLPKYGDCVLKNMNVDYAPNGFSSFENGFPTQIKLTLNFQEIEIMTQQKLRGAQIR